ncbi:MAG: cobalamin biosynthesis protein CbiG [Halochromatium sp.]|nr:cobalamin biosynthesis protein CbiG [Halochromatium sp.]
MYPKRRVETADDADERRDLKTLIPDSSVAISSVAIGIGCMRGTALSTLEAAVAAALDGLGPVAVIALASIERKRDEPALLQLGQARGWPLSFFTATELASVRVARPSPTLVQSIGTASVAEAAALLALANERAGLLVEKQSHRGSDGHWVSVAVAKVC